MSTNKIIIASALIQNKQGELLVVRKRNSEFYMLPGGKVQNNETLIQALIRELKEELNMDFCEHDFSFLGQHESIAVNEKNTIVQGNIFRLNTSIDKLPDAFAELQEVLTINKNNYQDYQLANLLKEFALPIWLNS